MSRITKQIAKTVANQLVLPQKQELQNELTKLNQITTECYLKTIPNEVMVLFETHPKYLKTTCSIKLNEHGFNYEYFSLTKSFPQTEDGYYAKLSKESCEAIRKQDTIYKSKKTEVEKLHFDIETALVNYRTYGNIEKEFPEAFKLLPTRQTTALIVNIKDIRCKLDKANC